MILPVATSSSSSFAPFARSVGVNSTVVVEDGQLVKPNLEKEGLSPDDIEMAVREHGFDKLSDVGLAVLENDGSVSVVGKGSAERFRRRRRVRFLKR